MGRTLALTKHFNPERLLEMLNRKTTNRDLMLRFGEGKLNLHYTGGDLSEILEELGEQYDFKVEGTRFVLPITYLVTPMEKKRKRFGEIEIFEGYKDHSRHSISILALKLAKELTLRHESTNHNLPSGYRLLYEIEEPNTYEEKREAGNRKDIFPRRLTLKRKTDATQEKIQTLIPSKYFLTDQRTRDAYDSFTFG